MTLPPREKCPADSPRATQAHGRKWQEATQSPPVHGARTADSLAPTALWGQSLRFPAAGPPVQGPASRQTGGGASPVPERGVDSFTLARAADRDKRRKLLLGWRMRAETSTHSRRHEDCYEGGFSCLRRAMAPLILPLLTASARLIVNIYGLLVDAGNRLQLGCPFFGL